MVFSRTRTGKIGEEIAVSYLQRKGYEILRRNYRRSRGEIDIVARDGDVLVFVEVKSARSLTFGDPILRIDRNKKRFLARTVQAYYQEFDLHDQDCRFDVVTVAFRNGKAEVHHVEDAFRPESER